MFENRLIFNYFMIKFFFVEDLFKEALIRSDLCLN